MAIKNNSPLFSPLKTWSPLFYFMSMNLLAVGTSDIWIHTIFIFFVSDFSLNIIFWDIIRVVACITIFTFKVESYSVVSLLTLQILFICPFSTFKVHHLGCFISCEYCCYARWCTNIWVLFRFLWCIFRSRTTGSYSDSV